ncbi:MAG: DUF1801 domain-containing protein [Bacteroidota bacterium]
MTTDLQTYLLEGCGRCPLGGTPGCKVQPWRTVLEGLREVIAECGLTEQMKWGVPCYTYQQSNVLVMGALKHAATLSFFKGALLGDPQGLLVKPGPNTQAARYLKFTSLAEVEQHAADIKAYVFEAIEVEKAGLKVEFKRNPEPIPEELEQKFAEDPLLKSAFESLTPGRQRGYILFFSAPKKAKTRFARIEKSVEKILNGKGLHDGYRR